MGRLGGKRSVLALVAVLLVLCVAVGGTVAYLTSSSGPVTNTFTPGEVGNTITEVIENGVKSNVAVQNTGNVDAYIRAKIVVNWANAQGDVLAVVPQENTDYTMQLGTNWQLLDDGMYYYKGVVAADALTNTTDNDYLIKECKPTENYTPPEDGYNLQVTILSESIQADGMASATETAVHNAWGHSYDAATGWSDS